MKRTLLLALAAAVLLPSCRLDRIVVTHHPGAVVIHGTGSGRVEEVTARQPPPAAPRVTVVKPPCPGPDHTWIHAHYVWRAGRYIWVRGAWVKPPRQRAVWVPGHYKHQRRGGGLWVRGHWRVM